MENNVFEQMGAQGVESPVSEKKNAEMQFGKSPETTLNVIANIVLGVGLIAGVICLFTICFVKEYSWGDYEFSPVGFATTVGVWISSATTWAVLRVLANISNSLRDLNSKK